MRPIDILTLLWINKGVFRFGGVGQVIFSGNNFSRISVVFHVSDCIARNILLCFPFKAYVCPC